MNDGAATGIDETEGNDPPIGSGSTGRRVELVAAGVLLGVVLAIVAVHMGPWLAAGLGDDHDGRNAGVWGLAARSLRDHPFASHLGGRQPDGTAYANHPPLIVAETAVTAGLLDDRPVGVRLPAILSSLAFLFLLWKLLREAEFRPLICSVAVGITATSGMFLVYGGMLDTPMIGLPFGAAALLVGQRAWTGRPVPIWVLAIVGLGAGLSSWQAALCAVLAGAVVVARQPRPGRAAGLWLIGAAFAGALLTLAWAGWAYGSLRPIFDQAGNRADGKAGVGGGWWATQRTFAHHLYGWTDLTLVAVAVVAGVALRRGRALLAISLLVVVGYAAVFRQGSTIHSYWNYWGLLPLGIGTALAIRGIEATSDRLVPRLKPLVFGAVLVLLVFGASRAVLHESPEEKELHHGAGAGDVLRTVPHAGPPAAPAFAYFTFQVPAGVPWGDFTTHGHGQPLTTIEQLRQLARTRPEFPVLVAVPQGRKVRPVIRKGASAVSGDYLVIAAGRLAPLLDPSSPP